ncbi:MAG: hypothetical protein JW759_01995 [Candidatus Coatesbacteria bacterium]|nr:hypothetical protein [Candidatus Coatesbacteria bacterium]
MTEKADVRDSSRTLIYVPIVHTQADMGALGESIHRVHLSRIGRTFLRRKAAAIDRMWDDIETTINRLDLVYDKVRLYQDGLPVCGREREIVDELAASGSRNHQLLLRMIEKGATLVGTESAELLIEEYELDKCILDTGRNPSQTAKLERRHEVLAESLLKARDSFIAQRINQTLRAGDTGVLFLGMLHSPERFLNGDIHLAYPIAKNQQALLRSEGI